VVSVAETVVDKDAVVIEFLHAPIAEIAVFRIFRSQSLTWYAHIVQMIVLRYQSLQKSQEIRLFLYIARIQGSG
jgi:hypothetical protein